MSEIGQRHGERDRLADHRVGVVDRENCRGGYVFQGDPDRQDVVNGGVWIAFVVHTVGDAEDQVVGLAGFVVEEGAVGHKDLNGVRFGRGCQREVFAALPAERVGQSFRFFRLEDGDRVADLGASGRVLGHAQVEAEDRRFFLNQLVANVDDVAPDLAGLGLIRADWLPIGRGVGWSVVRSAHVSDELDPDLVGARPGEDPLQILKGYPRLHLHNANAGCGAAPHELFL